MSESTERQGSSAHDIVAEVDTGARAVTGPIGLVIAGVALAWSLFQLYVASGVPFWLSETVGINLIFNNTDTRVVHLAFALALASFAYPLYATAPRRWIPWYDWLLAALGVAACLYLMVYADEIANRSGLPTTADLVVSTVGLLMLGVAVYRALGLPLVVVAMVFLAYVFFGHATWLPDAIQWKGASYGKAMWHFWMQTEGVFGVALGVSASMIFLFVLFGALLEKAGAGNYFIQLAFALLGHLRGGPAKAAVVASALSGLYSGSSIANVVTTGTFTIPLMKRTGFSSEKAGAVEVASSTNGQLTPPVMGAAAFLISEFTGVAYTDIIRHAFVPAIISYIALVYIVHLEALKMGLKGMEKPPSRRTLPQTLLGVLTGFIAMMVLAAAVYYGLGWIKVALPDLTFWSVLVLFLVAYVGLLQIASRHPDLPMDDPEEELTHLPRPGEVAITGLYFVIPIVILIWCILIERFSPGLSAYYATLSMIFIVLTQHPLKDAFRGNVAILSGLKRGLVDVVAGMVAGARNMIPIGVATAAAGIIVGTISLTGAHQVVGEFVEFLSGGNLMLMLVLVAVMSLILGLGLPTTANYIVVSSLMAPVVVTVGASNGLIVPLVAVHFFVFYFGILADDTPPVGLAAFAAAAISGGDPIKTGMQGFAYDIRTAILPFLFIFNTELLLIDVTPLKAVVVFCVGAVAMMLFAAATQGYFLTRSRIWESALLLVVVFTLFRPGFWLDMVQPPFDDYRGEAVIEGAASAPADELVRVWVEGPDFDYPDRISDMVLQVALPPGENGVQRLDEAGLTVVPQDGEVALEEPLPGTDFQRKLQGFDFYGDTPVTLRELKVPAQGRWPKEIFYLPALLLLAVVILFQRRRQTEPAF